MTSWAEGVDPVRELGTRVGNEAKDSKVAEGSGGVKHTARVVQSCARFVMANCDATYQSQSFWERTREGCACVERSKTEGIKQGQVSSGGQSYRERTHEGHACVERSKAKGIKQGQVSSGSQSYRERTHRGRACVERSKAEGIKQRVG
eukprot:351593-Chlamydomonas_euryale.AAC.1